jgi:CubicO group peptidase (beta-lactamase class C family)
VDRWLPGGPPQWSGVTLHHLLSHTAGVPHWLEAPGLDPAEPVPVAERLAAIQAAPLRTAPGQAWHYSSPGFGDQHRRPAAGTSRCAPCSPRTRRSRTTTRP